MALDPPMANLTPPWPTCFPEVGHANTLKSQALANLANLANLFQRSVRVRTRASHGRRCVSLFLYLHFRLARLARLANPNQFNALPWPTSAQPDSRGRPGWPALPASGPSLPPLPRDEDAARGFSSETGFPFGLTGLPALTTERRGPACSATTAHVRRVRSALSLLRWRNRAPLARRGAAGPRKDPRAAHPHTDLNFKR